MAIAIRIPDMGTTVDTVVLSCWLVDEGDQISRGDPIAEIQTDKANVQLESITEGVLLKRLVAENTELSVGQIVAYVGNPGEVLEDTPPLEVRSGQETQNKSTKVKKGSTGSQSDDKQAKPRPVPAMVRNLARKHQVDLEKLQGTGEGGVITREDVLRCVQSTANEWVIPDDDDSTFLLQLYQSMVLIRHFEERVKYLFLEGIMPGTIHQYQGQEAVAVGACAVLTQADIITSTHRPHGHALAKGLSVASLMNELFGKTTGCCRGKGGSMHVGDLNLGMVPAIAIVGGNVPLATGCALAFKMRKEPRVAVSFMGDGAINEGAFHEAVNMGAIWSLPVIYIIENNLYSASTPIASTVKLEHLAQRASGYGIPGVTVDGNDVLAVFRACRDAVIRARKGEGPTLIEAITYRITGHSRRDPCNYQPENERKEALAREPIGKFARYLIENGFADQSRLDSIVQKVDEEIEQAVQEAIHGPDPTPQDALSDVFVEG